MGLENAEGDYVAFTNASCIQDKDWLTIKKIKMLLNPTTKRFIFGIILREMNQGCLTKKKR